MRKEPVEVGEVGADCRLRLETDTVRMRADARKERRTEVFRGVRMGVVRTEGRPEWQDSAGCCATFRGMRIRSESSAIRLIRLIRSDWRTGRRKPADCEQLRPQQPPLP